MWSQRRRVAIALALAAGLMGETAAQQQQAEVEDDARTLVSRLSLEEYKATLRGLTQFGDVESRAGRRRKERLSAARDRAKPGRDRLDRVPTEGRRLHQHPADRLCFRPPTS